MISAPPLRRLLARLFVISGVIVVVAGIAAGFSLAHLNDENRLVVDRIDPADQLASQLLAGYLDQETGVRGYVLTGQQLFLQPYQSGQATVAAADQQLGPLLPGRGPAHARLAAVRARASDWEERYAIPAVAAVAQGDRRFAGSDELTTAKNLFDSLRGAIAGLQQELSAERTSATSHLGTSSDQLTAVLSISLAVILLDGVLIWLSLRRLVLDPIASVGVDARTVTSGDLGHEVRPVGPREIAQLGTDIEAMRVKIVSEITEALEAREKLATLNADLSRSNEDLEQFAYVASHDLQEPLRKVTSFCQLLEQRYGGQLDERADQYIAFAVDGAKRMQVLINDLLAFSRIGRTTDTFSLVPLTAAVETAIHNLAHAIDNAAARVCVDGELPTVSGDRILLSVLMQNLIGNAVKFRGSEPPEVHVAARPADGEWLISVSDNGIGIEPRFAERIFVIFQRLHGRDAYSGTGIGLAMCRKIVEFHGGRIWLDTEYSPGTRFCFTLPQTRSEEEAKGDGFRAAVNAG